MTRPPARAAAGAHAATGVGGPSRLSSHAAASRFARHCLEMVLAMAVGMVVLGPLESQVATVTGQSGALDGAIVEPLLMAANMTVTMAAWMRFRGHRHRLVAEMVVGMNAPFLALLAPLWVGAITGHMMLMAGHVLMVVGMLTAMLARRSEYLHPRATVDR
jgi:hypothetical protein